MNETLQGVIVGGIFASLGTVATLIIQYKQWKKEKKIEHLRNERIKYEAMFGRLSDHILKELSQGRINIDAFFDILVYCPEEVKKLYLELCELKNATVSQKRQKFLFIVKTMKEFLSGIDKKIETLLT